MNDLTPDREERTAKLKGMGSSRKRVEDVRFTQGKGNYVDDERDGYGEMFWTDGSFYQGEWKAGI